MRSALIVLSVAALAASAPGAAARPSPDKLYDALLAAKGNGVLPTATQPGGQSRRHHAVGEMLISYKSSLSRIAYVVFPTHADALANFADGIAALKKIRLIRKVERRLPGLPRPSVRVDASAGGVGVTQITFVAGNVEVAGQSVRRKATSGNVKLANRLAQVALNHLRSVEQRV
jgi:hypothetical protein